MPFRVPTFNLAVNIWRSTNSVYAAPDVQTNGNLSPAGKGYPVRAIGMLASTPSNYMLLRLPAGTDIRPTANSVAGDTVECPAGSKRFYTVTGVDDVARGFPNQYRFAEAFAPQG